MILRNAMKGSALKEEISRLRSRIPECTGAWEGSPPPYSSRAMKKIIKLIGSMADSSTNLLLTGDGENVKLIDFGLSVPATKPFMMPGNRTGTPNYMAPELVRRRPTDLRIEVFSFGVTAYEICTFELPWLRGTDGMAAMTHDRPPADIRKYAPNINPVLAGAIHACIEPERRNRCGSMRDFLQMIRSVEDSEQS